jgi:2-haloacid dehalogenase
MALDDIEALTFDVFGTVVDWRGTVSREVAALSRRHGVAVDSDTFADSWRGLYQPAMAEVREGRAPWSRLDDLHRRSLDQLLPQFGLDFLLEETERVDLNLVWHRLDPWPDAVAGLTRLKRRFILATLSNGNVRLMVDMARHAGLPWDAVLGAEVAKAYKPLPAAYLTAADLLCLPPARCLMVAAHYYDLVAARSHGFRTCYVRRPQEFGPHDKCDLPAEYDLDLVVEDFGELADRLGCA